MTGFVQDLARRITAIERRLRDFATSPQMAHSAIEDGAIQVYAVDATHDEGGLRGIIGLQVDGTVTSVDVNGPIPSTPNPPGFSAVIAGVCVSYDGTNLGDAVMPLDWAKTEFHVGFDTSVGSTGATLAGVFSSARGGAQSVLIDSGDYRPRYAVLRHVTTSGRLGPLSAVVGPVTPHHVAFTDTTGVASSTAVDAVTAALAAHAALTTTAHGGIVSRTEFLALLARVRHLEGGLLPDGGLYPSDELFPVG